MLYQKLYTVSLYVYAFLTSPTVGSDYYVSLAGGIHECTDNATGTCNIYCDDKYGAQFGTFDCGNAGECYFYCEEKKCAEKAHIIATNSNNLYVIAEGDECMKGAIINAPNYGNATFDMANSKKGFKAMKVYAGTNTQNIIIDINSNNVAGDDCKQMQVYGSTAEYVEISLSNGLEWEQGLLYCPVNSSYNGTSIAPCIIDASNGNGIIKDTSIVAPDGMPKNVWVMPGIYQGINTITCSTVDTLNGAVEGDTSTLPMDVNSDCWWNWDPTIEPTINPTTMPSLKPTAMPTSSPSTTNPSPYPSKTSSSTTNTNDINIVYSVNTNTIITTLDMLKYDTNKGIDRMLLIFIVVGGTLIFCCCFIIFCCIKKQHSKGHVSANQQVIQYKLKSNSSKHTITVSMSPRDMKGNNIHSIESRTPSNCDSIVKSFELNMTTSLDDNMPLHETVDGELDGDNGEDTDSMDFYASSSGSEADPI